MEEKKRRRETGNEEEAQKLRQDEGPINVPYRVSGAAALVFPVGKFENLENTSTSLTQRIMYYWPYKCGCFLPLKFHQLQVPTGGLQYMVNADTTADVTIAVTLPTGFWCTERDPSSSHVLLSRQIDAWLTVKLPRTIGNIGRDTSVSVGCVNGFSPRLGLDNVMDFVFPRKEYLRLALRETKKIGVRVSGGGDYLTDFDAVCFSSDLRSEFFSSVRINQATQEAIAVLPPQGSSPAYSTLQFFVSPYDIVVTGAVLCRSRLPYDMSPIDTPIVRIRGSITAAATTVVAVCTDVFATRGSGLIVGASQLYSVAGVTCAASPFGPDVLPVRIEHSSKLNSRGTYVGTNLHFVVNGDVSTFLIGELTLSWDPTMCQGALLALIDIPNGLAAEVESGGAIEFVPSSTSTIGVQSTTTLLPSASTVQKWNDTNSDHTLPGKVSFIY